VIIILPIVYVSEPFMFRIRACIAYDKTVINQRRIEKSTFEDQSEENLVWIIKWTTLLGIICKISFTPTVTFCYQVHADAHLSAALQCNLGATGSETSPLFTVLNSPHPIHAAHS